MFTSRTAANAQERIEHEIRTLSRALDELKHSASHDTRKNYDLLKHNAERLWSDSREHLGASYEDLSRLTLNAGRHARDCAREHPVTTLAVGLGVAAVIGWLLYRD